MARLHPIHLYCIGAQKSGTTWLSDYLGRHPEAYVPSSKEIDYFSSLALGNGREQMRRRLNILVREVLKSPDDLNVQSDFNVGRVAELSNIIAVLGGRSDYMSLFEFHPPGVRVCADVSPSYTLLSRASFADMAARHPDPRFILLMRDPVDRFWSSIRMMYADNPHLAGEKTVSDLFYEQLTMDNSHLVQFTRYGRVISELEAVVPRDRIHYEFYEHLFGPHGQDHLRKITNFLGIRFVDGDLGKPVWKTDTSKVSKSDLTPRMRAEARKVFDGVYTFVETRFGDSAPRSWLWNSEDASMIAEMPDTVKG